MRLSCDPNEILWYAMSSPFRREMKAKALLDAHHIENFIPMKKMQEIRDGEIKLLDYLSFACKPVRVLELLCYRFSADYRNDNNNVSKGNEEASYELPE